MKVIIFGATGTIGQELVQQALEEGHEVTAFSRHPEQLNQQHAKLHLFKGDVFKPKDVEQAIDGQDAVVVVLGSGRKRSGTVRSQGTKQIIEAMHQKGVKRLICQSTLGTNDSKTHLNFFWRYIMFGWFLKKVFLDHELQEQYVRESGLDWTIVRPGAFTNGPKTSQYQHGQFSKNQSLTLKISRADVADFLLKQLTNQQYLQQSPCLSY